MPSPPRHSHLIQRSNCVHGWSASGGAWLANETWTTFPGPTVLGSSFDRELMRAVGVVTSTEGRALHNLALPRHGGGSPEARGLNCFAPVRRLHRTGTQVKLAAQSASLILPSLATPPVPPFPPLAPAASEPPARFPVGPQPGGARRRPISYRRDGATGARSTGGSHL